MNPTLRLRIFGLIKIPMLAYVRPSVLEAGADRVVIRIRLGRRTRNHLGSMYFGALSVGADCAAGLIAMDRIQASGGGMSLIFKDFQANFRKRAEEDVEFTCIQGREIEALVDRARTSGEREEMPVTVVANAPSLGPDEPVAEFTLTLSLKSKDGD